MGFKKVDPHVRRVRKKRMIRRKIVGSPGRPRLVVFRSLKNIYAQLVDDQAKKTITTVSTVSKDLRSDNKEGENKTVEALIVGKAIAAKAKGLGFRRVVFDRSGYVYHGRIRALADGARQGGLEF